MGENFTAFLLGQAVRRSMGAAQETVSEQTATVADMTDSADEDGEDA